MLLWERVYWSFYSLTPTAVFIKIALIYIITIWQVWYLVRKNHAGKQQRQVMTKIPDDFAIPRYNPVHSEETKMEKQYKYSLFFKLLSGLNFIVFDFWRRQWCWWKMLAEKSVYEEFSICWWRQFLCLFVSYGGG